MPKPLENAAMRSLNTPFGKVEILGREALYAELLRRKLQAVSAAPESSAPVIALTGGSTPKAFYEWAAGEAERIGGGLERAVWTVSDERHVPHDHDYSNWGHALRGWLGPMGVPEERCLPWQTELEPAAAAAKYRADFAALRKGETHCYDLCVLGMGTDAHTASLFPECPLIGANEPLDFAAIEWPGKGWRLTITPSGLHRCKAIVVIVAGAAKADVIKDVLTGDYAPQQKPVQLLRALSDRTVWLLDEGAGRELLA